MIQQIKKLKEIEIEKKEEKKWILKIAEINTYHLKKINEKIKREYKIIEKRVKEMKRFYEEMENQQNENIEIPEENKKRIEKQIKDFKVRTGV